MQVPTGKAKKLLVLGASLMIIAACVAAVVSIREAGAEWQQAARLEAEELHETSHVLHDDKKPHVLHTRAPHPSRNIIDHEKFEIEQAKAKVRAARAKLLRTKAEKLAQVKAIAHVEEKEKSEERKYKTQEHREARDDKDVDKIESELTAVNDDVHHVEAKEAAQAHVLHRDMARASEVPRIIAFPVF